MIQEHFAQRANDIIRLLEVEIGVVKDPENDPRCLLIRGMRVHVLRFEVSSFFWSEKITVNFIEWPRQKLFEIDNKAIIGYGDSFVRYYLDLLETIMNDNNLRLSDNE